MAPVNIRKHDRLHGANFAQHPTLLSSHPKLRQTTKYEEWVHNVWSQVQQFSTLTGFPNFLLLQGFEKSDFSGHQFGVQKLQQKPVPPQRAFPVC